MNTDMVLSILGIAGCENCPDNSECRNLIGVNECQCNQGYNMNTAGTCGGRIVCSSGNDEDRGAGRSIIGGANIHIFVFCTINFF